MAGSGKRTLGWCPNRSEQSGWRNQVGKPRLVADLAALGLGEEDDTAVPPYVAALIDASPVHAMATPRGSLGSCRRWNTPISSV
ncbi:MAG: hypothetical protein JWL62_1011 [Hyphomicrobiales bacterium]|nr:hypothetical protein [Hyphomicrobiales bacterium]